MVTIAIAMSVVPICHCLHCHYDYRDHDRCRFYRCPYMNLHNTIPSCVDRFYPLYRPGSPLLNFILLILSYSVLPCFILSGAVRFCSYYRALCCSFYVVAFSLVVFDAVLRYTLPSVAILSSAS